MSRKQFRVESFDFSVLLILNLEKVTQELARECVTFWSGHEDLLEKHDQDVIRAFAALSANLALGICVRNQTSSTDWLNRVIDQNEKPDEGWPEPLSEYVEFVDIDYPEKPELEDLEVEEMEV